MLKRLLTLALGLTTAALVNAAPTTLSFSASGFQNAGVQFPGFDGPIHGSLTWESNDLHDPVGVVTGIDLTIAGHVYSLSEVAIANEGSTQTAVGGLPHGAHVAVGDGLANDFLFVFDRVNLNVITFAYTLLGKSGAIWWSPTQSEAHIVTDSGHVPETASALLAVLAVLALVGASLTSRRPRAPIQA